MQRSPFRNPAAGAGDPSAPQTSAIDKYIAGRPFNSKWNAYFSRVRIGATSGGAGAAFVVAPSQDLIAFGYQRGQPMTTAGDPNHTATPADTNLQTASQTVSGEAIEIDGIGLILLSNSDPALAKAVDSVTSVKFKLNGTTDYYLGIPSMLPGPGGLFGYADSGSAYADQQAQRGFVGAISNGIPHASNYYMIPEPMIWRAAGGPDSTLNVIFRVESQVSTPAYNAGSDRSAVAGGTGTSGTAAWTNPALAAVFADYMVVLVGRTVLPESDN
jgi:hypothetical protein